MNNELTPEQELQVRVFYDEIASQAEKFMPNNTGQARTLRAILLDILGYKQMPNGALVSVDRKVSVQLGNDMYKDIKDEWQADYNRLKDSLEASTSKQSKSTKVRKSVFPEDV